MLAVNHEALGERVGYSGVISQIMETYDEPPMGNKGSIVLQIKSISKQYKTGDFVQKALDDVSLNLRDSEVVAILGPSGSGKTTLLNIIGGLDRYDSGDLIINGVSTKRYKDRDWNSYRNHTIGFVFQSYNLIPHQTILSNVELALTISGVSRTERRHHRCQVRFDIERCADELDGPVVEHVRHDEHADDGADRQDRHERVARLVP